MNQSFTDGIIRTIRLCVPGGNPDRLLPPLRPRRESRPSPSAHQPANLDSSLTGLQFTSNIQDTVQFVKFTISDANIHLAVGRGWLERQNSCNPQTLHRRRNRPGRTRRTGDNPCLEPGYGRLRPHRRSSRRAIIPKRPGIGRSRLQTKHERYSSETQRRSPPHSHLVRPRPSPYSHSTLGTHAPGDTPETPPPAQTSPAAESAAPRTAR